MWYLKFKLRHKDCVIAPLVEKYRLSVEFFPLGNYIEGKYIYTSSIHTAKGNEKNIKKYLKELRKNKKVMKIEISKVIFLQTREKVSLKTYQAIYNPKLMYISPGHNTEDGYEFWEIASWDRKPLEELIKAIENAPTTISFEILRFEEKELDDVYIIALFPRLPKKQKEAIELAYREGYYNFPKKTNLDKLAKISKISKQTLQENLKKAEARLMPLLLRK